MKTQPKIDLYKLHKSEYAAPRKPVLLETKPAQYLAIEGQGAPGGQVFTAAIGALYATAFTIKMTRKFAGHRDYAVCKLEGLWWSTPAVDFAKLPPAKWRWKLLIRTPDFIAKTDLRQAVATLLKRGKAPEVKRVRLEQLKEGPCVQLLHVGPYDQVRVSIASMRQFANDRKLDFAGRHHEIYLSDPRRVPPERLRTILRQPLRRSK